MRFLMILTVLIAGLSSSALAQYSGTPDDQRACSANVKRFCSQAIQGGDMAILGCLQQNRPRLSKACKMMLMRYGQ